MSTFGPQAQIIAALCVGVGAVMLRLGMQSGFLTARYERRCPSCGRFLQRRVCGHCTRR